MKNFILFAFALLVSTSAFAQEFTVPKDYKLEKAEDYEKYNQDIIKCAEWLIKTPVIEDEEKRIEANKFIFTWMAGSPKVHLEIDPNIVTFTQEDSFELSIIFLAGWTKYALESGDTSNREKGNIAGIEAVIEFYQNNIKHYPKNKAVEKYIKLQKKGKLEEYIQKNIQPRQE